MSIRLCILKLVQELSREEWLFTFIGNGWVHAKQVLIWEIKVVSCLVLCFNDANVHRPLVILWALLSRQLQLKIVEGDWDLICPFFENIAACAGLSSKVCWVAEHIREGACRADQPLLGFVRNAGASNPSDL